MQRCRECKALFRQVRYICGVRELSLDVVSKRNAWPCYNPREMPLVVDALADELCKAIEVIELCVPNHPIRDSGDQALNRYLQDPVQAEGFRRRNLARHQKEA